MVNSLFQPLNIFLLGLGGGFLIPLLYRVAKPLPAAGFVVALLGMTVISCVCLWRVHDGGAPIEILTAGSVPPFSINLRFGLWEGFFSVCVDIVALLCAWHFWERLRLSYPALLLYLILIMGINGMVMTRDLFNQFVFLEIMSIGTYGLLGLERTPTALAASFKYIMATVLASSFFLLGAGLLYHVTGTLNIDGMIADRTAITGPIGTTALLFVLACLVLELKPFPANGWGLDVYETAPSGIAALVSVVVSAGVFFTLFKLLPLFADHLGILVLSGGVTFLFSNLVGLTQTSVQRMLGYSSIAQMGLLMLALALLHQLGAEPSLPLVVGGLFVNHLLAKAGLFWLAGIVDRREIADWSDLAGNRLVLSLLAVFVVAIAGLPPFPGFWAKWELVMHAAAGERFIWIAVILVGSLLEAAYMFRWFKQATRPMPSQADSGLPSGSEMPVSPSLTRLAPVIVSAILLFASGYAAAATAGVASVWIVVPLCVGGVLCLLDGLAGRIKCILMLLAVLVVGHWIIADIAGLSRLFAVLLFAGSLVIAFACLYRADSRPGFYPMMAILLLSITSLLHAATSLEFFFHWEIITLASYFLIAQRPGAHPYVLQFLLFSLVSAFCLLAGFGIATSANGSGALAAFATAGPAAAPAFLFLAIGFLIKAGAVGVHVWLPGAYAEADDDLSAMLSAVISKVAVFGLFMVTYLAIRSEVGLELAHVMGWIGLLTTLAGAVMAFQQSDLKRMLGYSSMSQIGYIITAIALMSHLGWVTAFYLVANHLMVKGILFLAAAAVILQTGTRLFDEAGGLAKRMPLNFASVVVALISMSGLPPLAGFGGKWLLLSAMVDRGWYGLAIGGLLATFIGFLYMFRFAYSIFLGQRKSEHDRVTEAPLALLVPQFILILAIFLLSFFPKLLMDPVSAAIDPYFASTLVWQGMSLETIYGYWNPVPIMAISVTVAALLLGLFLLIYRSGRGRSVPVSTAHFYRFYRAAFAPLVTPVANFIWDGVCDLTIGMAGAVRRVYTGNGQTYALHVLYYVIAVYLLGTLGLLAA
ncbi:formate hydrogenlyase subunit 3/multisubunit Na+/H+ antiporter MnhD subunit [Rhizobium sp. BK313]|uniref:proton-conducting transporter transmembrane domain-containing protein n=1 Tax=Rhizobium sp. BK313 TaxID=2587081 RepID=UPI001061222B|nr:proton-conducting transporter membrane subunit [Rhizobium sp. BK313]MBB3456053.1 formate hydrogenlyase subunit 3/multisubunit Na+/H+ antiporter MnhD subunit [Rhizobium sp. BK313]